MSVTIRAGLHTGECDRLSTGMLGGYAVDIAARVLGLAQPGEVVVSSTVKDLVAGSGINFQPLEEAVGDWRLFRVAGPRGESFW
jgi:class 3 adenylate cyclase